MGRYDRSIKIALDKASGKILDADDIFKNTKDAFQIRKSYHEKLLDVLCCECHQDLIVSGSKYDRLHFKHKPQHTYCALTDEKVTPKEQELHTQIFTAKESERHKELKNKIGKLLKTVPDVDLDSINIDSKFIIKDGEKRKPDVYCKFLDKEIVFEIQLSSLSLTYILNRYNFYKKHGIYLIWILDNFNIHDQGILEKDIKYLTKHHNFFKLDERSETFQLECEYKLPFLENDNVLKTKWQKRSVTLLELNFDEESVQAFYYNLSDNETKIKEILKQRIERSQIAEQIRQEQEKFNKAESKAKRLIDKIKYHREYTPYDFSDISKELDSLNEFEKLTLNNILNFNQRSSSPLISWINKSNNRDSTFLSWIIENEVINLDINLVEESGKTAIQALIRNKNITSRNQPILSLFKKGYMLTDQDQLELLALKNDKNFEHDYYVYTFCNKLRDRSLVPDVVRFAKLLFIIESVRQKELIVFNFQGNKWISFANNAISSYSQYWEYIELTFKEFGLWEHLEKIDNKQTFHKKLMKLYQDMPTQSYDFDSVFNDLYPKH